MKIYACLSICFLLSFCACDSEQVTSNNQFNVSQKKGDEAVLMSRYMSEMIANPLSQDHIDRNLIVNLLIDSLWDFQKTYSGIYYQIDEPGIGDNPTFDSKIICHYRGTFLNGQEFDSSLKKEKPASLKLDAMIAGWQEFVRLLKKGGKGTLIVPSRLAYGEIPPPRSGIPMNAVLIFEIELIDFE